MKKENLEIGKKVKIAKTINDFNGALYEGDIVTVFDFWFDADSNLFLVNVEDVYGKRHLITAEDVEE